MRTPTQPESLVAQPPSAVLPRHDGGHGHAPLRGPVPPSFRAHGHATARGHATRQSGATLNKHGRRPRGMALVLVIFAIAFLSVLAVAMLDQATTDLTILRNHTSGLRALYAAQAGIGDAIAAVRLNHLAAGTVPGMLVLPDGTTVSYSAAIANAYPVVTITSTGQADGFTRRLRAKLVVAGPPAMLPPYPVQVVSWQEVVGAG